MIDAAGSFDLVGAIVLQIAGWVMLNKQAVKRCLADGRVPALAQSNPGLARMDKAVWTLAIEGELAERCFEAASSGAAATSADEADQFRFVAQLVKTRYAEAAAALEKSHADYFRKHHALRARSFPEIVNDGLIQDVSRFRKIMERRLKGVHRAM